MSFSAPPHSSDYPIDLEQLLTDGFDIKIKPQGFSMYPLFFPGRDEKFRRGKQYSVSDLRQA